MTGYAQAQTGFRVPADRAHVQAPPRPAEEEAVEGQAREPKRQAKVYTGAEEARQPRRFHE